MLDPNKPFVANAAETASDVIDGEAVVIHFERGTYFSIGGLGAVVWGMMQAPVTLEGLAAGARGAGVTVDEAFRADLTAFVAALAENGLILPTDEAASVPAIPAADPAVLGQPLRVEAFSDLSDLIAIDPVHEVDVLTGWPRRAAEQVDGKASGSSDA